MPCSNDSLYDISSGEERRLKEDLDHVTRLLCSTLRQVESSPLADSIDAIENGELREWWEEHKRIDEAREAREREEAAEVARQTALREVALSKLSSEERLILGLK